jgi:hypothetical protein
MKNIGILFLGIAFLFLVSCEKVALNKIEGDWRVVKVSYTEGSNFEEEIIPLDDSWGFSFKGVDAEEAEGYKVLFMDGAQCYYKMIDANTIQIEEDPTDPDGDLATIDELKASTMILSFGSDLEKESLHFEKMNQIELE